MAAASRQRKRQWSSSPSASLTRPMSARGNERETLQRIGLAMLVPQSSSLRASHVRASIPASARNRSTGRGLFIFTIGLVLYLGTLLATVLAPWWPLKLLFSVANAFFLSTLFVIGHDACHEAFVPYRWLNAVLGRIAFLPSWHSYAGWE